MTGAGPAAGRWRRASPWLLAGLLGGAGVLHLAVPEPFDGIVPDLLPATRAWTYGSGVVELLCAAAVATPRTRHAGGLATAALFVAVFPANLQMAVDAEGGLWRAVAWARLPLQVPLVLWAVQVARDARPAGRGRTLGRR